MLTVLASLLLTWYRINARDLPWRGSKDPYAIWVSEIMLQQTRVETVIPYYQRWLARFPNLESLATASQQDVLSIWEGMGYYSRARNMHRTAQIVVNDYNGKFPSNLKSLSSLPGIGPYTSAAIASIAFGADTPAIDGNIRRVLARFFNVAEEIRTTQAERKLHALAATNLPTGQAGDYNQALMELGAVICTPKTPSCKMCPIKEHCQAYQLGVQDQRPILHKKPDIPHIQVTAAVITRDNRVLIARRPDHGLLGGLWEFPGGKLEDGEDLSTCLQREIMEELGAEILVGELFGSYEHAYTHFRITLHAFICSLRAGEPRPIQPPELAWCSTAELENYPMGKVDRQIARKLQQLEKDIC